jgi:hypothetical protein
MPPVAMNSDNMPMLHKGRPSIAMNSNHMPMLRKGMPPVAMNSNNMPMLHKGMAPIAMNSNHMPMLRKGMPPGRSVFGQMPSFRLLLFAVLAISLWAGFPAGAVGGGGPENVLLVVNRNSPDSLTIAHHYIPLRRIPAGTVLPLSWNPKYQTARVDIFRKKILAPILTAIGEKKRRLSRQIDYVIYSSDFPWGINLKSDVAKFQAGLRQSNPSVAGGVKPPWPEKLTKMGSINGLTYLWQPVVTGNPAYFQLSSNQYTRRPIAQQKDAPTLGFKSSLHFGPKGELLDSGGRSYMLSMMLAVTSGSGNSLDEVLNYLRRSAAADGTHPHGTIYFVRNSSIRSKVRDPFYPLAVKQLEQLGVAAEIVEGDLPMGKRDVQGAMIGWDKFQWRSSGSTILPGAICEHFTSFGGKMYANQRQTTLSELLRYGAAAASGTVAEPYAVQAKFPLAMMQVHYARGCTVAEAFYQSVYGPYQLLIVGDPLCRPWANIPRVSVEGLQPGATVKGKLTLKPSATVPGGSAVERFELFVDGWLRTECGPGGSLELDTTQLADGYHELRVVAVEAGLIQSQGRQIMAVTTANHGRKIAATVTPQGSVRPGRPLVVAANSPGSVDINVLHNSRLLGRIAGEQGRLSIDPATLGYGPVRLRVVGRGKGGSTSYAWARPLELTVEQSNSPRRQGEHGTRSLPQQ